MFQKLIKSLTVISLSIIFSHPNPNPNSEGCLLVLFIVSFAVQKLLSLIKSHLFIFVFISITLGGGSERILSAHQRFLLMYGREEQNIVKQLSSILEKMIVPPSPSHSVSGSLFPTSMSLFLPCK